MYKNRNQPTDQMVFVCLYNDDDERAQGERMLYTKNIVSCVLCKGKRKIAKRYNQ